MAMVEFAESGSRHGGEALLVDNVADRAAAGLGRSGQSDRRRERARVAPPKRAPSAPLWSAGVAKADRETIGSRVGLSSQWSTAEDGPFRIRSLDRLESPPDTYLTRSVLHLALLAAVSLLALAGVAAAVAGSHEATQFTDTGPVPIFCPGLDDHLFDRA
jgi:hypothetical protein